MVPNIFQLPTMRLFRMRTLQFLPHQRVDHLRIPFPLRGLHYLSDKEAKEVCLAGFILSELSLILSNDFAYCFSQCTCICYLNEPTLFNNLLRGVRASQQVG